MYYKLSTDFPEESNACNQLINTERTGNFETLRGWLYSDANSSGYRIK